MKLRRVHPVEGLGDFLKSRDRKPHGWKLCVLDTGSNPQWLSILKMNDAKDHEYVPDVYPCPSARQLW